MGCPFRRACVPDCGLCERPDGADEMNARQAAEYLGYAVRSIYNMTSRGILPYHKINGKGRPIYLKEELDALLGLGDRAEAILNANELMRQSGS